LESELWGRLHLTAWTETGGRAEGGQGERLESSGGLHPPMRLSLPARHETHWRFKREISTPKSEREDVDGLWLFESDRGGTRTLDQRINLLSLT
jgi:hypothetical protein